MKKILGFLLIAISITILVATFFPLARDEIKFQTRKKGGFEDEEITPLYPDFGIVIPKLGINSKVIKNVDPNNSDIYQKALTQGVAHALGTALPGKNGNIFIFSHSSENFYEAVRFNSIFYLLPKLEIGDTITLYYEDDRFDYHVVEKKIVDPNEVQYLLGKSDASQVTLMTCYPPGTDLKRYIILAK
jgi:sortase A